jgi:hypothetical protein
MEQIGSDHRQEEPEKNKVAPKLTLNLGGFWCSERVWSPIFDVNEWSKLDQTIVKKVCRFF